MSSLLHTTLSNGDVRAATKAEEDNFIAEKGPDHPISKQILDAREEAAKPKARAPKPQTASPKARSRGAAKAKASEAKESDGE